MLKVIIFLKGIFGYTFGKGIFGYTFGKGIKDIF